MFRSFDFIVLYPSLQSKNHISSSFYIHNSNWWPLINHYFIAIYTFTDNIWTIMWPYFLLAYLTKKTERLQESAWYAIRQRKLLQSQIF